MHCSARPFKQLLPFLLTTTPTAPLLLPDTSDMVQLDHPPVMIGTRVWIM